MTEMLQEPIMTDVPDIGGIITKEAADKDTDVALRMLRQADRQTPPADRPGWIPPDILFGWDTDPYAYQTEEEMMPAGGPHGRLLGHVMGILEDALRGRDLMLLMDIFLMYWDSGGVRQRVAPDLTLMPFRLPEPPSHNLGKGPPPLAVAEITSPSSRPDDMGDKVLLYAGFGIPTYLVIDLHTTQGTC